MQPFSLIAVVLGTFFLMARTTFCAEYNLGSAGAPPEGLAAEVKQSLSEEGYRITSPDGMLCELWLVKAPLQKQGFAPDLQVKYPFEEGALVGAIRVGRQSEFTDFRDQVILPGLYLLRYGQQPEDGNHIGTSPQSDFLLALSAAEDKSAGKLDDVDKLNEVSARAAGSSHPAIFSLLTPEAAKSDKPELTYQSNHDFWVLQTPGDDKQPSLRLVVIGIGEE